MKNSCIFMGIMAILFAILFIVCLFKIVSGKYDRFEDHDLLIGGLLGLFYTVVFGCIIYMQMSWLSSPPVISSCTPVVTQEGDTLYKLCDSTRYCKHHIEENEVSTRCTITKKDTSAELLSTDTCEICSYPLCEHWKRQSVGYDGSDIPAW